MYKVLRALQVETGALRLDGELWVGCASQSFEGDFQVRLLGSWDEPWRNAND